MADPVISARRAREALARALAALESPEVPPRFLDAAEPVARAIRALHSIESTAAGSIGRDAVIALDEARRGLALLQDLPASHPEINAATAAVARSLSLIHGLTELGGKPMRNPAPTEPTPVSALPPTQPSAMNPAFERTYPYASPGVERTGDARQRERGDRKSTFRVDLAAHSTTNFYKSRRGDDVILHGGIFVATYRAPEVGTEVRVVLSISAGHELEARGVVRWRRTATQAGPDTPPGFGAHLTEISPEGRELIYRYARNREPILHDDL